jgi:hypothetical protein
MELFLYSTIYLYVMVLISIRGQFYLHVFIMRWVIGGTGVDISVILDCEMLNRS